MAVQAILLTCGDITPGTDKTATITQHDNETESTAGGEPVSLHDDESKLYSTYLARAVSEATLICVQAVTTIQSRPLDDLPLSPQGGMLTGTEYKGTAVDQENTSISSLSLCRRQEDDVTIKRIELISDGGTDSASRGLTQQRPRG